jgi:hypothetical protein
MMGPQDERRTSDEYLEFLKKHDEWEREARKSDSIRMQVIEGDLAPLKKMYWAVVGSGAVGVLLLAVLVYVYQSDRGAAKDMAQAQAEMVKSLHIQGTAIEKLLISHQELEKDYRRDYERVEKQLEKLSRQ